MAPLMRWWALLLCAAVLAAGPEELADVDHEVEAADPNDLPRKKSTHAVHAPISTRFGCAWCACARAFVYMRTCVRADFVCL